MPKSVSLAESAVAVLETGPPRAKAAAARASAVAWRAGRIDRIGTAAPPGRPARPTRPDLRPPREVPRRRITSGANGRIALLHALAHIELNAIDLAFDIIARFSNDALPRTFFDDWIAVGDDEARHYLMLDDRLTELGAAYGDLAAHDGLWQAAVETSDDLLARLAIVPLVLEARGLDVTPPMIARLRVVGDNRSADLLQTIHDDEIRHVAAGVRWFRHVCDRRGLEPAATYRRLLRERFKGRLKPPFNRASRDAAGLTPEFYQPGAEHR
ncbi:MAG: ferritin-like domain-containing protein [Rhodospirillales bacterium]|nr:MAG: ferritin-like domain-containing protein [Rhodospirillales bacterium]